MPIRAACVAVIWLVCAVFAPSALEGAADVPAPVPAERPSVVQLSPAEYGTTVAVPVGGYVMARLSGVVTFYFDRARLDGPAVKTVYVAGGPRSYVLWFRVSGEGEGVVHLPFFSVDPASQARGAFNVTVRAAGGKPAAPPDVPVWIELPPPVNWDKVEIEVPSRNTVFMAWPLSPPAAVPEAVDLVGTAAKKLMDPRWTRIMGEHEGEWLVTMVETVAPGTAVLSFGKDKTIVLRVKQDDVR